MKTWWRLAHRGGGQVDAGENSSSHVLGDERDFKEVLKQIGFLFVVPVSCTRSKEIGMWAYSARELPSGT